MFKYDLLGYLIWFAILISETNDTCMSHFEHLKNSSVNIMNMKALSKKRK